MNIRLLALDLDHTTLDENSRLSPGNRKALLSAAEKGMELVIASGRAYSTLPKEMTAFPGVRYAIVSNGAGVHDIKTGRRLFHKTLSSDLTERILACCRGKDLALEVFWEGGAYCGRDYWEDPTPFMGDESVRDYVQSTRTPVDNIFDFIRAHAGELESIAPVVSSPELKEALTKELEALEEVYITTSVPRLIELSHRDSGKHRALEFLSEHLGIPGSQIAAFGNGDNDAEMLAWAGLGVAVANGSEKCRTAADHITGHYLADGLARALYDLEILPD